MFKLHRNFYYLIFVFCVFTYNEAKAGAWGLANGSKQLIIDGFVLSNSETQDRGAVEYYSESGVGRGFSLVSEANLQFEQDNISSTIAAQSLKFAKPFNDNWSAAISIGVDAKIIDADAGSIVLGPVAKLMLGRGFKGSNWVNLEYGAREGNDEPSFFGEVSLGHRFGNEDMVIAKYMGEGGYLSNFGNNFQVSYIKSISPKWKLDFGFRQAISNNGRPLNSGLIIGIWWQK